MSRTDGKDKFYRTLNLDKDDKFLVKWLRQTTKELKNDEVQEEDNE